MKRRHVIAVAEAIVVLFLLAVAAVAAVAGGAR